MRRDPDPGAPRVVTWGIGDFLLAWFVGLLALVAVSGFLPAGKPTPLASAVMLTVQDLASIAWLVLVSRRKGRGSLGADFGLTAGLDRIWTSVLPFVGLGVAVQVVVLQPLAWLQSLLPTDQTQSLVEDIKKGSGVGVVVLGLVAILVAPLAEELLFRGVLLRSLLRHFEPGVAVFVSATIFAGVHPLLDPSWAQVIAFPALLLVGLICGFLAVRSGNLWRSVAVHVGFNAVPIVLLLVFGG